MNISRIFILLFLMLWPGLSYGESKKDFIPGLIECREAPDKLPFKEDRIQPDGLPFEEDRRQPDGLPFEKDQEQNIPRDYYLLHDDDGNPFLGGKDNIADSPTGEPGHSVGVDKEASDRSPASTDKIKNKKAGLTAIAQ